MIIHLNTDLDEQQISVLAACVARVANYNFTDLLSDLLDQMTTSEKVYYCKLYRDMEFSESGRESPL